MVCVPIIYLHRDKETKMEDFQDETFKNLRKNSLIESMSHRCLLFTNDLWKSMVPILPIQIFIRLITAEMAVINVIIVAAKYLSIDIVELYYIQTLHTYAHFTIQ